MQNTRVERLGPAQRGASCPRLLPPAFHLHSYLVNSACCLAIAPFPLLLRKAEREAAEAAEAKPAAG